MHVGALQTKTTVVADSNSTAVQNATSAEPASAAEIGTNTTEAVYAASDANLITNATDVNATVPAPVLTQEEIEQQLSG